MRKNWKKRIALLLAASMVFTMNATVFAEEVVGDEGEAVVAEEAGEAAEGEVAGEDAELVGTDEVVGAEEELVGAEDELVGAEDELVGAEDELVGAEVAEADAIGEIATVSEDATVSGDATLSDNRALSWNLVDAVVDEIKGTTNTYFIVQPVAVAYKGQKVGSKKHDISKEIKVYYVPASSKISANDVLSNNAVTGVREISANLASAGVKEATIKKVKIKGSKGATVDMTGAGTVPVNKSTYIASIKLEDKTMNKELGKLIKDQVKTIKKNKTQKVSANGFVDGKYDAAKGEITGTDVPLTIAVYPVYGGNDATAVELAKQLGLNTLTVTKEKLPKSIKGTVEGKKVTLKLTKKTDKPKGIAAGGPKTCKAEDNSLKVTSYYVLDGNFTGNYYT